MRSCTETGDRIALYLDGELDGSERALFEGHVAACAPCRAVLDRELGLLARVRSSRPFAEAPQALRGRVVLAIERDRPVSHRRVAAIAAAIVLMALAAATSVLGPGVGRGQGRRPSEFAMMAVDAHLRWLGGRLPLEVHSASPEVISGWFTGKVDFGVRLPNYQEISGQERLYSLEGARLVGFKDGYAAFITYRMGPRPISLVITSESMARPEGGEEIVSRGLTFHFDSVDGLKVITWSDGGLTYALVSDLEERGQQSCIVCHAGTRDREFIESLKP